MQLFTIHFKKTLVTLKKKLCSYLSSIRNAEPPDEATARDVIDKLFFSDKRYDLGDVGRYRINKKLGLNIDYDESSYTRKISLQLFST
jgi:DNA-directed RNA polymerase subunit beta